MNCKTHQRFNYGFSGYKGKMTLHINLACKTYPNIRNSELWRRKETIEY